MMKWMRDNAVMKAAWDKMSDEEKTGEKFPIGVFLDTRAEEYGDMYSKLIDRIGGKNQ